MSDTDDDLVPVTVACEMVGGKASPINPSTWYRGVRDGRFPKPIKIGPATSRWRRSEILALIESAAAGRNKGAAV